MCQRSMIGTMRFRIMMDTDTSLTRFKKFSSEAWLHTEKDDCRTALSFTPREAVGLTPVLSD